jgi:hypothetical protein
LQLRGAEARIELARLGSAAEGELPQVKRSSYGLDDLLGRAKYLSFGTRIRAEQVYRAREAMISARNALLPSFRLSELIGLGMGGSDASSYVPVLGSLGNLLPFLFPKNWFEWKRTGHLLAAERSSFLGFRADQMNALEELFWIVQRDRQVLSLLDEHIRFGERLFDVLQRREQLGALPSGSAQKFGAEVAALEQDDQTLTNLLEEEFLSLSEAANLDPEESIRDIEAQAAPLPTEEGIPGTEDLAQGAQASSLELASMGSLIQAAKLGIREVQFDFLDPMSWLSVDFGHASRLRVARSQLADLMLQKEQLSRLLEQRSAATVADLRGSWNASELQIQEIERGRVELERMDSELSEGSGLIDDPEFASRWMETEGALLKAQLSRINSGYRFAIARGRVDRLTLQGIYSGLDEVMPVQ